MSIKMTYSNNAVLIINLWMCFKSAYSIPTFTNEYVHIKLHVPEKTSEELLKNLQEFEHSAHITPVSYHKVIHHYHKRRRPYVRHNFIESADNALESIVLSENDHKQDIFETAKNIETYVVKPTPKIKQNVKTLKIIEEKQKIPYEQHHHTETFKVINAKEPQQYSETYKIVETKIPTAKQHHYHTETFKVSNDIPYKHHSQQNYYPFDHHKHSLNAETFKIINENFDEDHLQKHQYASKPYTTNFEIIETKLRPPPFLSHEKSQPTHVESVQIVKEKTPYTHYKQNVESYHTPVIKTTAIEVQKSQTPYHPSEHINDSAEYTNSYATVQAENPNSGYTYEQPSTNYREEVLLINKPPAYHSSNFVKNEYPLRIPSSKYQHETQYHVTDTEPQSHHSYGYSSGDNAEQTHQVYDGNDEENQYYANGNQYDFARDEDLLSEILDATRHKSPTSYEYKPPKFSQNIASDIVDSLTVSEAVEGDNRNVAETYRGVDSYSVNHVQGIGSGGFDHHSPFL